MSAMLLIRAAALSALTAFGSSSAPGQITIPTVFVAHPGNAADATTGYGSVAYSYNIGAYEVTAGQYAAFLNAVARTDANALYHASMADAAFGCGITRSGVSGGFTYSVNAAFVNLPVNYVGFWDALRFANWLHNGQPTGPQNNATTEAGAYTLTPGGVSANTVSRNANWRWAVTSENEWYKAAYHQPASLGGDTDDYWLYPNSSNTITTAQANYDYSVGATAPVGSYAANFCGAFVMGGNVWEWNEAIVLGSSRGLRGGSLDTFVDDLRANSRSHNAPLAEVNNIGFRVSRAAPPAVCVGDLNGDSAVNTADLAAFLGLFGARVAPGGAGDFNNDGAVNTADLAALLGRLGSACRLAVVE